MGVNGRFKDQHTSLFLKDVSGATGTIANYDSIAGYAYCRGNVAPKVVGYYLATSVFNSAADLQANILQRGGSPVLEMEAFSD